MTQGNAAIFEHRSDPDRELALADFAVPEEALGALPIPALVELVDTARLAPGAIGIGPPTLLFEEFHRRSFVATGSWQGFHLFVHAPRLPDVALCVK
jgi:hypothetical protein